MKYSSSASTQRMELIKISDLNLTSITKNKLDYNSNMKDELVALMEEQENQLSNNGKAYLRDEIARCTSNIEYYTEILKIIKK